MTDNLPDINKDDSELWKLSGQDIEKFNRLTQLLLEAEERGYKEGYVAAEDDHAKITANMVLEARESAYKEAKITVGLTWLHRFLERAKINTSAEQNIEWAKHHITRRQKWLAKLKQELKEQ